jgi:hypothetical protein
VELLAKSRKHPASQLCQQIPRLGPIRVVLLIALIQTPHRFRTKRQLWAHSGLALQTRSSGEYRFTGGQLQPSRKAPALRGLNVNQNHDLKNIFKSARMVEAWKDSILLDKASQTAARSASRRGRTMLCLGGEPWFSLDRRPNEA